MNIEKMQSNPLYREWVYFRRGHVIYLAFITSLVNFITIQYAFVIEKSILGKWLTNPFIFGMIFIISYIVIARKFGKWDYNNSFKEENKISALGNPWITDVSRAIIALSEGKNSEVSIIMQKWVEKSD